GSSVAANGGTCTISVTFTPTTTSAESAAVTITDNANNVAGSTQSVSLIGTGTGPGVSLSPSSLTFTSQNIGTTSSALSSTLTNTGSSSLTITSVSLTGANPGDFTKSADTCTGFTIPAAPAPNTCSISVTFTPTAILTRTASVSIADNASGSPQLMSLTGTGSAPIAGVTTTSPFSSNVGTPSATQTVTLSNTGNVALSITGIGFTGANPGDFGQTNTCGSSLAAGGNCPITVTFTPAAEGSRSASLIITDN